ncbi:MAG: peptidoglycan editing factor PgeF [Pseudomonadota bacterium]|nr:peptidoglycan editing factor PgeF [Pseudomonadota bacterium]MDP1903472.1 peptidoglycan editing factor PgeF [Pseudomonadota bacterium]MDP2351571.1 peptidoglycan editing factor PgeF [Pseudomonadota bacterium]
MPPDWITPDWPAPDNVRAFMTTRAGGVSRPPFDSFNLAAHVDDDPAAVAENRRLLRQWLPAEPLWLNQVHGTEVAGQAVGCGEERTASCESMRFASSPHPTTPPLADAAVAFQPGEVRAVLTADCLPVLFCDTAGTVVAAAHAGWRGLAGGVLEATVAAMNTPPERILAWLGAAIGPTTFEVGDEVREAFISRHPLAGIAFRPALPGTLDEAPRKWLADIYVLARIHLATIGVTAVYGGGLCTHSDPRFFSYRREPRTGRMASVIWMA